MGVPRKIFVVSAPSGAGKTTLNRLLIKNHKDTIAMSVSYTARAMRKGDVPGVDYHFVTRAQFEDLIKSGQMLEYADVFGSYYGTSLKEIERIHRLDRDALLEIDVQGWAKAKAAIPLAKAIFILPPTFESLWERLSGRGTEPMALRVRRLETAIREIEAGRDYPYFVINDRVEEALGELEELIIKDKIPDQAQPSGLRHIERLSQEFKNSKWIQNLFQEYADKKSGE
jgi:guanylate kinase